MSRELERFPRMPRVRRRVFLGGVVTGAAALLAACGGAASPAPTGGGAVATTAGASVAPASGGKKKDVLFWGRQQFLAESNNYLTESVKLAAQKGNFNVKVELFTNDEHAQKEVVAMESGNVPDITYTYAPALWYRNGYGMDVQPLYDEIGKAGGGWIDFAAPSSTYKGVRVCVPMNNEPWFLHLRKDIFEGAGYQLPITSWDTFLEALKKVNAPDKGLWAYDGQMTEADWTGNCLQFMWAHGGRLFDKDGNPTIDTPQNVAGVTAYTDLFKNKEMPPDVVSQLASGNNEAWLSKKTAAVSNPGSIVLAMRKDDKDLLSKTYLQAFPVKGKDKTYVQTAGAAALVINKKSQAIDEAGQIAKMIMAPDRYPTQLEKAGSYWFSILKNYLSIDFFTNDPWNRQITENIVPWTIPANAEGGLNPILDDIGISATKDMLQAIVVQNKRPEEAIKILADAAAKAKEKFK